MRLIEDRKIHWLKRRKIEGEDEPYRFNEVHGLGLVPVADAEKVTHHSTRGIRKLMNTGKLTRYNFQGKVKRNKSNKRVYFDLYEYYDNQ